MGGAMAMRLSSAAVALALLLAATALEDVARGQDTERIEGTHRTRSRAVQVAISFSFSSFFWRWLIACSVARCVLFAMFVSVHLIRGCCCILMAGI